jgi:NADH dehydrogenase FAD-containing subunit
MAIEKKKVVVVGMGIGGWRAYKTLTTSKNVEVVCVDPKTFFEFTPSLIEVKIQGYKRAASYLRAPPKSMARKQGHLSAIETGERATVKQ